MCLDFSHEKEKPSNLANVSYRFQHHLYSVMPLILKLYTLALSHCIKLLLSSNQLR